MSETAVRTAERPPANAAGRRLLTLDDLHAMMRAGIVVEGERSELVEGELIVMPSEGDLHVDHLQSFTEQLRAVLPSEYVVVQRGVLNRAPDTQLSPDVAVWPAGARAGDMTPANVLLVVEISDTTARGDKREKAPLYARMGVPELWIMDVPARRLLLHRDAAAGVWPNPESVPPGGTASPRFAPSLKVVVPSL